jgi:hypothetical protein
MGAPVTARPPLVNLTRADTGEVIGVTSLDFVNRQLDVHRNAEAAIAAERVRDHQAAQGCETPWRRRSGAGGRCGVGGR